MTYLDVSEDSLPMLGFLLGFLSWNASDHEHLQGTYKLLELELLLGDNLVEDLLHRLCVDVNFSAALERHATWLTLVVAKRLWAKPRENWRAETAELLNMAECKTSVG